MRGTRVLSSAQLSIDSMNKVMKQFCASYNSVWKTLLRSVVGKVFCGGWCEAQTQGCR